jgi:hypothetical protein
VTEKITIRPPRFGYVLTRFVIDFTKRNKSRSNFQYQAAIQLRF